MCVAKQKALDDECVHMPITCARVEACNNPELVLVYAGFASGFSKGLLLLVYVND